MSADDRCPECTASLVREDDETVCTACGLVVDTDRLDRGPEWRSFAGEESNRERTGAPLTRSRHDRGLSTEIGSDAGVRVTGRKRKRLARMRREHSRAQLATKQDRNQVYAFTEIRRLIGEIDLPRNVREQACALFDSAQSEDLIKGRSLEGFAAATVYAVCRTRSIARTVDEVVAGARADEDELRAAYDALNRELGLPTGPIDPGEYVPRFASELDLPDAVERRALELAVLGQDAAIAGGRDPSGFAAGCLYTAAQDCGHGLTQCDAADAAGVSPVTLRKAHYDIEEVRAEREENAVGAGEQATEDQATEEQAADQSQPERVPDQKEADHGSEDGHVPRTSTASPAATFAPSDD
ncbi:transcription initiation factor IIB family protein [Salinarchaeum chitinilyticum]